MADRKLECPDFANYGIAKLVDIYHPAEYTGRTLRSTDEKPTVPA
jgi:hypothetical protein